MNPYPLTETQFTGFCQYKDWDIREISSQDLSRIPHIPRREDVVATFVSGDMNATKVLNGIHSVIGMDIIVHERRPDVAKNEPPLNIYHCVIQKLSKPAHGYTHLMYGPSESDTLFGHWKDISVLDEYIKISKEKL
jgi:hypothetical protein